MLRTIAACVVLVGLTAGCADLRTASNTDYCLTPTGGGCSELEGNGDCRPCPDTLTSTRLSQSSPATP